MGFGGWSLESGVWGLGSGVWGMGSEFQDFCARVKDLVFRLGGFLARLLCLRLGGLWSRVLRRVYGPYRRALGVVKSFRGRLDQVEPPLGWGRVGFRG